MVWPSGSEQKTCEKPRASFEPELVRDARRFQLLLDGVQILELQAPCGPSG